MPNWTNEAGEDMFGKLDCKRCLQRFDAEDGEIPTHVCSGNVLCRSVNAMGEHHASVITTIEELYKENKELRKMVWLSHGCTGLYGDDGEMQCARCFLDFKRDSIETIQNVFRRRSLLLITK